MLVGIGLIPDKGVDMLVTIAASFAASIQVSSFNRLGNSGFATTMCTGNLRIAVKTAHAAIAKKDKYALQMSVRYWIIILAFVIGAGAGGFATAVIGDRAILDRSRLTRIRDGFAACREIDRAPGTR